MKPLRPLLILLLTVWALTSSGETPAPLFDEFRWNQIGVEGVAWTTTQLTDGRLLFGFESVVEFDGNRWRSHPVGPAVAVRAIAPAEDGRVWIGGVNELGFLKPQGQHFRYHSLTEQLPPELHDRLADVWYIFPTDRGAIFVAKEHVVEWLGHTFRWWPLPGARRLTAFRFEEQIYIAHNPSGLLVLKEEGPQPVLAPEAIGSGGLMWMGRFNGQLILATTSGLLQETSSGFRPFSPALTSWIRENVLTTVLPLRSGALAIGSLHGGVMILRPDQSTRHFGLSSGLPADSVYSLFEDREGYLWVTSPTRLLRFIPDDSTLVFASARGESLQPLALGQLEDDLVVGTANGLLRVVPAADSTGPRLREVAGPRHHVFALHHHPRGIAFAHRNGVSLLQRDQTLARFRNSGFDTFALAPDWSGEGFLAAEGAQVWHLSWAGEATSIGSLLHPPTSLATLEGNAVIAGTAANGIVTSAMEAELHPLARLLQEETGPTLVAPMGGMLLAGRGRTLGWYEPAARRLESVQLAERFRLSALATSAHGAWIGGERSFGTGTRLPLLYRLRHDGRSLRSEPWTGPALSRFGTIGVLKLQSTADQEYLWVGGPSGLLRLATDKLVPPSTPRAPLLHVVAETAEPMPERLLPYQRNRLEVEIGQPEPGRSAGLLVQTMLAGSDNQWDEPQERNEVRLANLQQGRYQLQVRFVTADGQLSESSSIAFRVAPPWWLTGWALSGAGLGLGGIVFGAVRLRVRGLRRRADRLERLVQERTALLTHANQTKTEFVAKMSHELRNPLNGIVACAHALEERGLASEQRELVATMRHCAELLDALIGDVLDFSEIESGRITLQLASYDPVELASRAITMIEPIALRKGLTVELRSEAGAPRLAHGDPARVQQVILNLLGNAVKFAERGLITLHIAAAAHPIEAVVITVADEGPGIPAAEAEKLFEKFSRMADARLRNIPGNGLGLAVCRQLVERMGGQIWLDRTRATGAAFTFQLPLGLGDPARPAPTRKLGGFSPRSALVVEDIDYNARAMIAMLGPMGCSARTAPDAATALTRLREEAFDVVFLDFDLPDMSGPDLARAILANPEPHPQPPLLIATTAYADEATRELCLRAGMHGFLTKPVSPDKIRQALAAVAPSMLAAPSIDLPETGRSPRPGLDFRLLRMIAPTDGALQEQVGRLREMLCADLLALKETMQQQDFTSMHSIAHRIVSHARFVGADTLAAIAGEVQRGARDEPEAAVELIPALETELHRVAQELAATPP